MNSIVSGLTHLSGWVAYTVIGALVFGETAIFLGFVLPGETAAVLGGVLASRGHLSLATLCAVVVVAAVTGPLVGYEIGRRTGDRLFAARALRRVPGGAQQARSVLRERGGLAVFLGRFVAFLRAVMPAAAGAVQVRYRTFLIYNVAGGIIWGVGYCLLGYLAGSAYSAVESRVGTGLAIAVAVVVVAAVVVWTVRRHRVARAAPASNASAAAEASPASDAPPASNAPPASDASAVGDAPPASDASAVGDAPPVSDAPPASNAPPASDAPPASNASAVGNAPPASNAPLASGASPGSDAAPASNVSAAGNASPVSDASPGNGAAEAPNAQPVAGPADQHDDSAGDPPQIP